MSKNTIILLVSFMVVGFQAYAQKHKDKKKLWASDYNYEATCEAVGVDGTKVIQVNTFARKADQAIVIAKKRAIAACLFRGVHGASEIEPIITDRSIIEKHQEYFENFFETGNLYLNFIAYTNDHNLGGKEKIKMKKGYKIRLKVSVAYDALREEMEKEGFAKKLGEALEGAKKPTIMILPSLVYCHRHESSVISTSVDGVNNIETPDYKQLFNTNSEIRNVIAKIEHMMIDRDFPIRDLESSLNSIEKDRLRNSLSNVKQTQKERLLNDIQPDLVMDLDFEVKPKGLQKYVTFTLKGIDAYTDNVIASTHGTGEPSYSASPDILLEEAVLNYLDNFNADLQKYFDNVLEKGRPIQAEFRISNDNEDLNFESEFNYDIGDGVEELELFDIIDNWIENNAVKGVYSNPKSLENVLIFNPVNIPLFNEKDKPIDAKKFFKPLRDLIKKELQIPCKIDQVGLGKVLIILGEE